MPTDGIYNRRPWDSLPEARLTATLGALTDASAEQIATIRPPIPAVPLFPPRFGMLKQTPTVETCFRLPPRYATAFNDHTRVGPGYSGTQTPTLNQF